MLECIYELRMKRHSILTTHFFEFLLTSLSVVCCSSIISVSFFLNTLSSVVVSYIFCVLDNLLRLTLKLSIKAKTFLLACGLPLFFESVEYFRGCRLPSSKLIFHSCFNSYSCSCCCLSCKRVDNPSSSRSYSI